ncbi:predicted protein [Sclerotinia sclerotiorum 1980 UF-70]|uniref:Uncharacterized protein n=1 Tax=Sclerotinia sclerotiorum (strain ATCC 18683 / 1980 / Ss-1) TaxID=665079 RepID=A7EAW1_SCLS1|nr:predicted protein [Sclerotinia sclerotiorum 1980 UF-70]EDN99589.1 predicted protein [Sclerotinia sclerotiorum 1980 UF-70]
MAYMEAVGDDEQVSKDTFVSDTPRIIPTVKIFGKRMRRCMIVAANCIAIWMRISDLAVGKYGPI